MAEVKAFELSPFNFRCQYCRGTRLDGVQVYHGVDGRGNPYVKVELECRDCEAEIRMWFELTRVAGKPEPDKIAEWLEIVK